VNFLPRLARTKIFLISVSIPSSWMTGVSHWPLDGQICLQNRYVSVFTRRNVFYRNEFMQHLGTSQFELQLSASVDSVPRVNMFSLLDKPLPHFG
jgi:hypothetical protein